MFSYLFAVKSVAKISSINQQVSLMMRQVMCLIILPVLSRIAVDSTSVACSENRLLMNLNKLLNQNHVKIINGITLRRKSNAIPDLINENSTRCIDLNESKNLMKEINVKVASLMNTHVLEFDLSSTIENGKVF